MQYIESAISENLAKLRSRDQHELADLLEKLTRIAMSEPSETFDRSALLKQVQVLSEEALLPPEQRKRLQINASLFYISLFSAVRGIGTFLIEHQRRLDDLLGR
jgi:hypothetical protein